MAPDKIYTFQDDGDRYWYKPEEWETPPLTRVEYIRKDALLEWVKERKNINLEEADEKNDMFFYDVATGFAAMIDKLNSM